MAEDLTLSEAISNYLRAVKLQERNTAAQELSRFARWYGGDRPIRPISPGDLERYQDQLVSIGGDPAKLGQLRQFFVVARQRKLTEQPLATHIRIRRKAATRARNGAGPVETIEITQTGHDQLQAELVRLETIEQPRAREELQKAAADKDFRENAPYDAAKQHLAELQRRVNDIRATLSRATIVAEREATDRAGLGSRVVVRALDEEGDDELTYTLVGPGEVDPRRGKISAQSPVGRALMDRESGDTIAVETPMGVTRYRVERIER